MQYYSGEGIDDALAMRLTGGADVQKLEHPRHRLQRPARDA
jgi:hypothetical protein